VKHDGFRVLARKQGERVQVWSRHAQKAPHRTGSEGRIETPARTGILGVLLVQPRFMA
jgi:hypothetical protein